jgi:arsenate reductase
MRSTLYGLKTCDTCRKARAALEAAGHGVEFIDIRADADLAAKLPGWIAAAGDRLVNRSSTTWRGLTEAERATAEGRTLAALLIAHPALIKRPVIESGGTIHVGWGKDTQAALL